MRKLTTGNGVVVIKCLRGMALTFMVICLTVPAFASKKGTLKRQGKERNVTCTKQMEAGFDTVAATYMAWFHKNKPAQLDADGNMRRVDLKKGLDSWFDKGTFTSTDEKVLLETYRELAAQDVDSFFQDPIVACFLGRIAIYSLNHLKKGKYNFKVSGIGKSLASNAVDRATEAALISAAAALSAGIIVGTGGTAFAPVFLGILANYYGGEVGKKIGKFIVDKGKKTFTFEKK